MTTDQLTTEFEMFRGELKSFLLRQYLCQLSSGNWLKNGMNHAQAGNLFKDLG